MEIRFIFFGCYDVDVDDVIKPCPDKSLARDAYYCAMAEIVMDTEQRASGIVASTSTSDRGAFHLLPALESAQLSSIVDTHRRARIGRPTTLMRSPATPSTANGGAAPVLIRFLPPIMPRIPSLSLLDPAEPVSPTSAACTLCNGHLSRRRSNSTTTSASGGFVLLGRRRRNRW